MDTQGQELGSHKPVSDALILAAIERAIRHGPADVWIVHVGEHLGFRRNAHSTRYVRAQLERMRVQQDWVESEERMGRDYWRLTEVGERYLAWCRAGGEVGELPESPQHRAWRKARAAAAERIDGFRALLSAAVQDTHSAELELSAPSSATWSRLGARVAAAAWLVGSATYCLEEWAEPSEDCIDIDPDPYLGTSPRRRAVVRWEEMEAIAKGEQP